MVMVTAYIPDLEPSSADFANFVISIMILAYVFSKTVYRLLWLVLIV
jgi:hypothetical protein